MPSSENFVANRIKTKNNKLYGIRVAPKAGDAFCQILGDDWSTVRWYASKQERDKALQTIGQRHLYSRIGDEPALTYEAIEQDRSNKTTQFELNNK